jgi:hypothetical protein
MAVFPAAFDMAGILAFVLDKLSTLLESGGLAATGDVNRITSFVGQVSAAFPQYRDLIDPLGERLQEWHSIPANPLLFENPTELLDVFA